MTPQRPVARATLAAVALALLAGCAAPRIDDNVAAAHADVAARGGPDFAWLTTDDARAQARADVARRLRQPLSEDDAQRIAPSHAPALQALLFDRAAASADATQAARLPNPVFALERLASGGTPDQVELTRSLTLPLLDLLLLPTRVAQADAAQQRLRLQLAADVLRTAGDARAAWRRPATSARCNAPARSPSPPTPAPASRRRGARSGARARRWCARWAWMRPAVAPWATARRPLPTTRPTRAANASWPRRAPPARRVACHPQSLE